MPDDPWSSLCRQNCDFWAGSYDCAFLTKTGCDCTGCSCAINVARDGEGAGLGEPDNGGGTAGGVSPTGGNQRRCFTRQRDFLPGALAGRWESVDWSEEVLRADEVEGRRKMYGNMSCPFEEERKACGRKVGIWSKLNSAEQEAARENAAFARSHMELKPGQWLNINFMQAITHTQPSTSLMHSHAYVFRRL